MAPLQGSDGFGEFSESLCYGFMLMYIHMYISRLKIAVNTNTDSVHVGYCVSGVDSMHVCT